MKEKNILDFLRALRDHRDEGERWLREILAPTPSDSPSADTPPAALPEEESEEIIEDNEVSNEEREEREEREETQAPDPLPEEFASHLGDSLKCLEGFRTGRKPSAEDWDTVFSLLFSIVGDAANGVITPATTETLLRAVSYDRAVGIAMHEGEIKGRNARIEEQLLSPVKSDGLPSLQGARGGSASPRRSQSIFDLAGEAR